MGEVVRIRVGRGVASSAVVGEELLDRMIEAWDTPDSLQDNVKNNPNVA